MAEQARTLTSLSAGEDFADPGREIPLDPSSDHYIANRAARWCGWLSALG
jgi:hypothetical protein